MATVVDALIVTLGLDAKNFKSGAKDIGKGLKTTREEAKRTGADIERKHDQTGAEYGAEDFVQFEGIHRNSAPEAGRNGAERIQQPGT